MAARLPAAISIPRPSSSPWRVLHRCTSHAASSPCRPQPQRVLQTRCQHNDAAPSPLPWQNYDPKSQERKYPRPKKGTLKRLDKTSLDAFFVRGGTSNGLVINRKDLPEDESEWGPILSSAMGSPDPYGRQLNGMGSGISSTSKIMVISASSRGDVDVNYTFVQTGIKDGKLDMEGNCGNMSSAVGPVAWDWGFVRGRRLDEVVEYDAGSGKVWANLTMFNTNTEKIVVSKFRLADSKSPKFMPHGHYKIDGVPGTGSAIKLSFMDPGGAKTGEVLPTGNEVDILGLPDGTEVKATLTDVANPGVFIAKDDLGISQDKLSPEMVESDPELKVRLEHIRQAGASKMGLDPQVQSIPKVVIVYPAQDGDDVDIQCQALSMGQAHRAVPLTLALCLGAACKIPNTLPAQMVREPMKSQNGVIIGHPSGMLEVGTTYKGKKLVSADLMRTARVLMKGTVMYEKSG